MLTKSRFRSMLVAAAAMALFAPATALAQLWPSTDLLVPWFEVDLEHIGQNTFFSINNSFAGEVSLKAKVYTNWGIPVLTTDLHVGAYSVMPFSLRDWLVNGALPDRQLSAEEIAHVQAALSGRQSPVDGLYYSTEVAPGLAVGSIRLTGWFPRGLWGDVFLIDASQDAARGDMLVDLDSGSCNDCRTTCTTHGVRFLQGGGFGAETEVVLWSPRRVAPQESAYYPEASRLHVILECFSEQGELLDIRELWLLPLERLRIADLNFTEHFGWLRITTPVNSYAGLHLAANHRFSLTLETTCLPPEIPSIHLEKHTNGVDADLPPGVAVGSGETVEWTYIITNQGSASLVDVVLSDDQEGFIDCPEDTLGPGQTMTCSTLGVVDRCTYGNVATVTGRSEKGTRVSDSDPSHYYVPQDAALTVEKKVNGLNADLPPGPQIPTHDPVTFTYEVTNTGSAPLEAVTVSDDVLGAVPCPKSALAPGETMVCTKVAEAAPKQQHNVGTATATTPSPCAMQVSASDPGYYYGWWPDVDIEKATNGHDADTPPGPQIAVGDAVLWTYVVINTGDEALVGVTVQDDKLGAVSCPKTSLQQGETMTCTANGTATLGAYGNLATVVATVVTEAFPGATVSDEDPSHYFGVLIGTPAIDIEKHTNGYDADEPPGPKLDPGERILWEYIVTNTGEVPLSDVSATDDQGVAVSCPKATLAVGETMVCTGEKPAGVSLLEKCAFCQYVNIGTAQGLAPDGTVVSDSDPSHHQYPCDLTGCTLGYWKNHLDSWPATGYSPSQSVASVFAGATAYSDLGTASLWQALYFHGGTSAHGAAEILLRAAVASLLNAAHPGVDFPKTVATVVSSVDAALSSGDRTTMLHLAAQLDAANNLGCPLH